MRSRLARTLPCLLACLVLAGCSSPSPGPSNDATAGPPAGITFELQDASYCYPQASCPGDYVSHRAVNITFQIANSNYPDTFYLSVFGGDVRAKGQDGIWYDSVWMANHYGDDRCRAGSGAGVSVRQGESLTCRMWFQDIPVVVKLKELEVAWQRNDISAGTPAVYLIPDY